MTVLAYQVVEFPVGLAQCQRPAHDESLAAGETDPVAISRTGRDSRLRTPPEELRDALGACADLNGTYRRLLPMALAELELIDAHIEQLEREAMELAQTLAHRLCRLIIRGGPLLEAASRF